MPDPRILRIPGIPVIPCLPAGSFRPGTTPPRRLVRETRWAPPPCRVLPGTPRRTKGSPAASPPASGVFRGRSPHSRASDSRGAGSGRRAVLLAGTAVSRPRGARRSRRRCSPTASASSAITTRTARPQGIFCANGQCAQCSVIADGLPVKSCMVAGAGRACAWRRSTGMPELPGRRGRAGDCATSPTVDIECLIIGGGPAGLSAAIELGRAGVRDAGRRRQAPPRRQAGAADAQVLRVDRRVLRRHARHRHRDAARDARSAQFENVRVWLNSTALAVFSDRRVGILRDGRYYHRPARDPARGRRRAREVAGLPRQHAARRLRRRRVPDAGQPRPGAARPRACSSSAAATSA